MSTQYRILKLRSGEEIIAKIVGQQKNVFIVERPFMFKTMPIMDHFGNPREVTTLRNWVKHTTQLRIKIPKDHIAMFMDPDPDAAQLYEMEMEREDTASRPKKIGPLDSFFKSITGDEDPDSDPTLEEMIDKGAEISSNQIQYSLLDRRPDLKMNEFCKASGVKLLPYGVLAGGFLSNKFLEADVKDVVLDTGSKRKYSSVIRNFGGWGNLQRLLKVLVFNVLL